MSGMQQVKQPSTTATVDEEEKLKVEELETELEKLNEGIRKLPEQISNLRRDLAGNKKLLSSQYVDQKSLIQTTKSRKDDIDMWDKHIQGKTAQIQEQSSTLTQLMSGDGPKAADLSKVATVMEGLEKELLEMKKQKAELDPEYEDYTIKLEKVDKQISKTETDCQRKETEMREKQEELEGLRSKREEVQGQLVHYTTQITVPQHKVQQLERQRAELEVVLRENVERQEEMRKESKQKEEKVEVQFTALDEVIKTMQEGFTQQIQELTAQMQQQTRDWETRLREVQAHHEQEMGSLRTQMQQQTRECETRLREVQARQLAQEHNNPFLHLLSVSPEVTPGVIKWDTNTTSSTFTIRWQHPRKTDLLTGYEIQVTEAGREVHAVQVGKDAANGHTININTRGKPYKYTVCICAVLNNVKSPYNTGITVSYPPPPIPTQDEGNTTHECIHVARPDCVSNTKYKLTGFRLKYRMSDSQSWHSLDVGSDVSLDIGGLTIGTEYVVSVRAVYGETFTTAWSEETLMYTRPTSKPCYIRWQGDRGGRRSRHGPVAVEDIAPEHVAAGCTIHHYMASDCGVRDAYQHEYQVDAFQFNTITQNSRLKAVVRATGVPRVRYESLWSN